MPKRPTRPLPAPAPPSRTASGSQSAGDLRDPLPQRRGAAPGGSRSGTCRGSRASACPTAGRSPPPAARARPAGRRARSPHPRRQHGAGRFRAGASASEPAVERDRRAVLVADGSTPRRRSRAVAAAPRRAHRRQPPTTIRLRRDIGIFGLLRARRPAAGVRLRRLGRRRLEQRPGGRTATSADGRVGHGRRRDELLALANGEDAAARERRLDPGDGGLGSTQLRGGRDQRRRPARARAPAARLVGERRGRPPPRRGRTGRPPRCARRSPAGRRALLPVPRAPTVTDRPGDRPPSRRYCTPCRSRSEG